MNVGNAIIKPIVKGCKSVAESSKTSRQVAKRAAKMKNASPTRTAIASGKATVAGALSPIVDKVVSTSDSFGVVAKTLKKLKKKGIKKSKPDLKEAVKEIAGINDVIAAKEAEGTIRGVLEAGKAATRLTTTLGLFTVGNVVPLPGMSLIGWVTGEKIANLVLGKPFTKQAKNIIK